MAERQLFLFLEPGSDPATDRLSIDCDGLETLLIWVPDAASAANVADHEATVGLGIVELYRGFDLIAATTVLAAAGERTAVGVALYPHGVTPPLSRISRSATIFRSGPGTPEPIVRSHPGGGSTVVAGASDLAATLALAQEFADDGVDLVEICGGEPLTTAARVFAALAGRVPISYVTYPYDSLADAAAYKASFAEAG